MSRVTIHKNEVRKYFIENNNEPHKIGEEKMRRWIDVPEYLEVEPARTNEPLEVPKLLPDTKRGVVVSDFAMVADELNLLIARVNEIITYLAKGDN